MCSHLYASHVYSVVRLKDFCYIIMVTNVDTGTHRNMSVYNKTSR